MNEDIRNNIILKLIHNPWARFSDLWDKDIESNTFTYHLKKLETEGLLEKCGEIYKLTSKGKRHSAFVEGDTGERAAFPISTVIVIAKDGDKILSQKRLKEPFYGCHGFISGKVNFGFNILECAKRDFMEEAGLEGDLEFKGMCMAKTFNDDELIFHHYIYYVLATNTKGKLIEKTHKAENFWVTIPDTKNLERFPDFDEVVKLVQKDKFFIRETERYQEKGKFVGFKLMSQRFL